MTSSGVQLRPFLLKVGPSQCHDGAFIISNFMQIWFEMFILILDKSAIPLLYFAYYFRQSTEKGWWMVVLHQGPTDRSREGWVKQIQKRQRWRCTPLEDMSQVWKMAWNLPFHQSQFSMFFEVPHIFRIFCNHQSLLFYPLGDSSLGLGSL